MLNLGGYYKAQPFISRPGSAPQAVPNAPKPQPAAPYAGGPPTGAGYNPYDSVAGPPQQVGIVPSLNLSPPQGWGNAGYNNGMVGGTGEQSVNTGYANGGAGIGIQNTGRGMAVNGGRFNGMNVDAPMGGGINPGGQQMPRQANQQFSGGNVGRGFNPFGGPDVGSQLNSNSRAQAVYQMLQRMRGGQQQQTQQRPRANGFAAPNAQQQAYAERMRLRYPGTTINW